MTQPTPALRCHDPDACAMGQTPCPTPRACGCAPIAKPAHGLLQEAVNRIEDMLQDDDGQAFKEARKFIGRLDEAPAPENVREGEPYDNPAFEELAGTMGVWGTAQAALCAQFFLAGRGALPAGMEPVATIASIDEHGPCFGWHQHWVNFPAGTQLYTAAQVLAMGRVPVAPTGKNRLQVPHGWMLVPSDATPEWLENFEPAAIWRDAVGECIRKMLAAAPRPPAAQEDA